MFDSIGNCPGLGNPYQKLSEAGKMLFESDGSLATGVYSELIRIIEARQASGDPVHALSDIAAMVHAARFANSTKGYCTAYMYWRYRS